MLICEHHDHSHQGRARLLCTDRGLQLMEPNTRLRIGLQVPGRRCGGLVGVKRCVDPKMLLQVHPQGRAQLSRQRVRGLEGHVQGSLVGCLSTLGGQTLRDGIHHLYA